MIPYDIDPSLHSGEPVPAVLDDGFSPPLERPPAPVAEARIAGPPRLGPGPARFLSACETWQPIPSSPNRCRPAPSR